MIPVQITTCSERRRRAENKSYFAEVMSLPKMRDWPRTGRIEFAPSELTLNRFAQSARCDGQSLRSHIQDITSPIGGCIEEANAGF
jgi:hypothetical protein